MEYIDVIDKDTWKNTGVSMPKSEIHKNGDWHKSIHAWLVNSKNEILIQRRSPNKVNFPNFWDVTIGGHISSGESVVDGAIREIKEEIGIDVVIDDLKMVGRTSHQVVLANGTYFDNEKITVYVIKNNLEISHFKIQYEEVEELRWIPIAEFKKWVDEKRDNLTPNWEEYEILLKYLTENAK